MAIFSQYFRPNIFKSLISLNKNVIFNKQSIRNMSGHETIPMRPSRWQWNKFKDLLHYYLMIGAIPLGAVVLLSNIFIGPATLSEIPEGYNPKHWEYHRHPITRFFSRYIYPSSQQEYEKLCHFIYEENERKILKTLEKQIKAKMAERKDYKAYYYWPIETKYARATREEFKKLDEIAGDNIK